MREDFEPFNDAEEVWFWFCASIKARGDGIRSKGDFVGKPRCCEVSDVYRIIKKMKRNHHLSGRHLRTMAKWGDMFTTPWYDKKAKRSEVRLWEEGLHNLDVYLHMYNIL